MKETKQAAASPEARAALHEVLAAFEGFKAANDQRLAALETKRADALLEEKVARIDDGRLRGPGAAGPGAEPTPGVPCIGGDAPLARVDERKAAFDRYIKTGETPQVAIAAGSQGPVGRRGHGRRLCRPGRAGAADPAPPGRRPVRCATSARCAPSVRRHLPQAGLDRRPGRQLGGRDRRRGRRPPPRPWTSSTSRPASSTPARPPPRPCSTTPMSISTSGWPRRCRTPSPPRRPAAFISRRRGQQAQGPAGLHGRPRRHGDLGPARLPGHRGRRRLAGQPIRPTS
jgi:hypothetical protein